MSTPERDSRLAKLKNILEKGISPYPNRYKPVHLSENVKSSFEEGKEIHVIISGRVMLFRNFGKASFATIKDSIGTIQVYGQKDILNEEYEQFKKIDVGDIIGVEGELFKTHKGEITVNVKKYTMLAKALLPLPEKFHGLTDVEMRYRQRYTDLIVNDEVKQSFILRSKIIQYIRDYLVRKDFLEVETPMLQQIPGGANARPFETYHNALKIPLFLRIAPELYLKRLIVGGMEKVFELSRVFRNEGISTRHNPEFTLLEVYSAYSDYEDMLDLTESLINSLCKEITGKEEIEYQGKNYSFKRPFQRMTMKDAIKKYAGIDIESFNKNADALSKEAKNIGINIKENTSFWNIVTVIFEELVEEKLDGPIFITHYPAENTPLAKQDPNNLDYVERFELFISGREHANAYSELNDPIRQRENFERQVNAKAGGDDEAMYMDEDFICALETGMPPTGGLGIGIDRLIMLFINTPSIRDTILFPQMKPKATAIPEKWKNLTQIINKFSNAITDKIINSPDSNWDEQTQKIIKKEKFNAIKTIVTSILEEPGENILSAKLLKIIDDFGKEFEKNVTDLLKEINAMNE